LSLKKEALQEEKQVKESIHLTVGLDVGYTVPQTFSTTNKIRQS
jgi:hypothetical protein